MTKDQKKVMNLYRIVNPCNRVIDLKEFENDTSAYAWLLNVQAQRQDPFLEIQTKIGRNWRTIEYPPPPD